MNDGEIMLTESLQAQDTSAYNPNTEQMRRSCDGTNGNPCSPEWMTWACAKGPFSSQSHRANLTECNEDERADGLTISNQQDIFKIQFDDPPMYNVNNPRDDV
jgi:hypothetical protein